MDELLVGCYHTDPEFALLRGWRARRAVEASP